MVEAKQISRFFLALVSAGGEMTRTHLAGKIWQRNWTSKQLDELLASPLLAGLVVTSREHVRGTGRHPVRYVLTGEGWAIARTWQLPMPSNTIAPEETRRQFQMLVQGGNLWARDLDRDARAWRAHMEQERQKRDARIAAEKERAKEFAKENKPPRKRSEKDLAQRRAFVASKNAEKEQLDRGASRVQICGAESQSQGARSVSPRPRAQLSKPWLLGVHRRSVSPMDGLTLSP